MNVHIHPGSSEINVRSPRRALIDLSSSVNGSHGDHAIKRRRIARRGVGAFVAGGCDNDHAAIDCTLHRSVEDLVVGACERNIDSTDP